jgi:hypothetical protein
MVHFPQQQKFICLALHQTIQAGRGQVALLKGCTSGQGSLPKFAC